MSTRSVLGLLYTARTFIELGHDISALMKNHGLNIETLDANARIEGAKELEILNDIYCLNPDPSVGLDIGSKMGLAGYGPLSMLLMTCKNAYEACQVGTRYQALTYLFGDISLQLDPSESALIIEPLSLPERIASFVIVRDIAGTFRFVRDIYHLNEAKIELSQVHFTFPTPKNIKPYEEVFKCPVRFNQRSNSLRIKTQYLQKPFPQANPNAFEMYKSQCDKLLLEASESSSGLAEDLQRYLSMFNYEIPSVVEAAATFGMSERTFRRQLKQEDTNYQAILDGVRYDKSKQWLGQSSLPIEEIASKLGYQEAAAFNHAFKRWSGTTPSQFRKHSIGD